MSIQIKNLTSAVRSPDTRTESAGDESRKINRIPLDNKLYDLYVAPGPPQTSKAAIVKIIRIVNTHSDPIVINLFYTGNVFVAATVAEPSPCQCLRRHISPPNVVLPEGFIYIDECEITVDPGARIQASAKPEVGGLLADNWIDYLISGVEQAT